MAFIRLGLPLTLVAMLATAAQAQWTRLWDPSMAEASVQPARRSAHAATTFGDHLYVYGGIGLVSNGDDDDQEFSDTWAFDLTRQNWARMAQTTTVEAIETPDTRFHVSGALHANASVDEFVLFGGVSLAAMLASDGSSTSTTAPVLTASSSIPVAQYNDVWRLQLAADEPNTTAQWVKDAGSSDTTGELAPLPRSEAGIAIHDNQLLVFGGISYDPPRDHDDLWSYDLATLTWTQLVPASGSAAPPSRFSHSVTMIDVDSVAYLLVFSGRHLAQSQSKATWSVLDDLWLFDLASRRWVSVEASAAGVPPRAYTAVVSIGSSMWFFEGYYRPPQSASGYVFDDVVRCSVTIDTARGDSHMMDALSASVAVEAAVVTSATPSLRYNHAAALWRDSMVVFGGSYQIPRSDVWVFNATGVETREPSSAALNRLPMGVETLVYVLGGFTLTIIAALLVLIVRWRRIDRQNMERMRMRGASVVRGVTKERLEQLEITKYHKPQGPGGGASGPGGSGALEEQRPLGGDGDAHNEDVCPICLVEFEDGEEIRRLPCKHIFHVPCIDEWLRRNTLCPMWKSNVDMDVVDVTIEDDHAAAATTTTAPSSLVAPIRAGAVVIPMDE